MMEADFEKLAEAVLAQIRHAVEASTADVDVEMKGDGVLELEFGDGAKMVINRHSAAREIWVAARSGGFHFRWDGQAWRDTRDNAELFGALSKLVSLHGAPVVLAATKGASSA
jgi:CyaY protein